MSEFKKFNPCCSYEPPSTFYDGYSGFELLNTLIKMINDFIDYVNSLQTQLDAKEDSENITNNRKLSENGDFTGTLCNNQKTACEVVQQIDDNRDTITDIRQKLEDKVSLEFIIDGGVFPFTDPPVYEIDGGVL